METYLIIDIIKVIHNNHIAELDHGDIIQTRETEECFVVSSLRLTWRIWLIMRIQIGFLRRNFKLLLQEEETRKQNPNLSTILDLGLVTQICPYEETLLEP